MSESIVESLSGLPREPEPEDWAEELRDFRAKVADERRGHDQPPDPTDEPAESPRT